MTDAPLNLELNSFLSDEAPDDTGLIRKAPWKFAALFLAVLSILAYFISDYAIETRKQELVGELQRRLEVSAAGKAQVIETWLTGTVERADRISKNNLFQLFATEINLTGNGKLPRSLSEQLPYMQNAFTNFALQDGLIGAYLIGTDGRAYLSSGGAPTLNDDQRKEARSQYEKEKATFLPLRSSNIGLVLDILLPIQEAQSSPTSDVTKTAGVLLLTVPASKPLAGLLQTTPLGFQAGETRLYQEINGSYYELLPQKSPYIAAQENLKFTPEALSFREVPEENGRNLYSSGSLIDGTNLIVLQQLDSSAAYAPLRTYGLFIIGLTICFLIIIFTFLTTIWLILKGQSSRALAHQYKEFATQINVQKRLLGSINNTIDELIGLTDPEGRYIYANPSLARLADYPLRSIPGKTDRDLFGEKTAQKLAEYDRKAITTEQTVNAHIEIETRDGLRTLRIAKSRFLGEDGKFLGIVTVSSDISDYIEHQRRKEEMDRKAISVLSQMLEANDPYLSGHSARMAQIANHITAELGLSPEMAKVIDTGAHLSQIGKISIPREIRQKEARLDAEEQKVMQKHVLTAEKILANADVDKQVLDAVTQINESLDGNGYPRGLTANEIGVPGQILGISDILIARISPRSYREAISVAEALRIFRNNPAKYDPQIVEAMTRFFDTETGSDFKTRIERTKN